MTKTEYLDQFCETKGCHKYKLCDKDRCQARQNSAKAWDAAIDEAKRWLLNNGFVNMESTDTYIYFKSGYICDFLDAMK